MRVILTDDAAPHRPDLGTEYRSVAAAFGCGWDDMVAVALDGVEACWLDEKRSGGAPAGDQRRAIALVPDASSAEG